MSENIFNKIREEHEEFREMMKKIVGCCEGKEEAFEELKKELEAHMKAEEQTLYEEMKQNDKTKKLALVGVEEHRMGTGVVNKMDRAVNKWSEEWLVHADVLEHLLEKHMEVEEAEVLPMAESMLNKKAVSELSENFMAIEERIEKGR